MDAQLNNLAKNLGAIAQNDALKGFVPVLDTFLEGVQTNQAGKEGLVLLVNALGPNLIAAAPQVGAQALKDGAGELKTELDAAAKTAEGNGQSASTAGTAETTAAAGAASGTTIAGTAS